MYFRTSNSPRDKSILLLSILLIFHILISQVNLISSHDFLFLDPKNFTCPNSEVYEFPKSSILSSTRINKTYDKGYMKYGFIEAPDNHRKFIYDVTHEALTHFQSNYLVTTNLFVTYDMSYVHGSKKIRIGDAKVSSKFRSGPLCYYFKEVILLGTGYTVNSFGHTLQDFFHPFLLLPEDVKRRAVVIGGYSPVGKEIYALLGYNPENWIRLDDRTWAFCSIVHIFSPRPYINCYCDLAMKMKVFFFEKFNLTSIKPTRYCFSNRPENRPRYINNLEEIFNASKKEFPQYNWEFVPDYKDLKTMAKAYASYKFLFSPTGSNLIKTYFMHNETVIVSPSSRRYDFSVMANSLATRVFFLHFPLEGMYHSRPNQTNIIPIPYALIQIRRGVKCLQEGKWENAEIKDIPQKKIRLLGYKVDIQKAKKA